MEVGEYGKGGDGGVGVSCSLTLWQADRGVDFLSSDCWSVYLGGLSRRG